jgi:hypothetical protein
MADFTSGTATNAVTCSPGFGNSFSAAAVTGIVLAEAAQQIEHAPVRQHHFESQHQLAHIAVAQHVYAAGIGRNVATDGATTLRRETEREIAIRLTRRGLQMRKDHARFCDYGHAVRIDISDAVHPRQGKQHSAIERNLAAHQPGIAALRHNPCARLIAEGENAANFRGGLRFQQQL